jgi:hypothetical protein
MGVAASRPDKLGSLDLRCFSLHLGPGPRI